MPQDYKIFYGVGVTGEVPVPDTGEGVGVEPSVVVSTIATVAGAGGIVLRSSRWGG